jgi:hypothetical protein
MAVYSGTNGFVTVGAVTIAETLSFSVNESSGTTPRTVLGDEYDRHIATTKSWSGSIKCFFDDTNTTGQGALLIGATVSLILYPIGNAAGRQRLSGSVIITGLAIGDVNNEGLVEVSFDFQGTGLLTRATA